MDYSEIKNYLEGKTSPEQSEEVRKWLVNPNNETQARKLLGEIWSGSQAYLHGEKPDFDQMLARVRYRIQTQSKQSATSNPEHRLIQWFMKVAAILVLPLILLTAYLYFQPKPENVVSSKIITREIYTKPGTRTSLELADGTKVWLNDATHFKYPEYFSGKNREVFVDGEAYFEVKSNSENPFVVNNPIMNTIVTGTHFNINAYSTDGFFEATLLEGKIHLEGEAGPIELEQGQQVQFDTNSKQYSRKEVNPQNAVAWIDGKLVIYNERLEMAAKKLSRWYNVEIVVGDPELNAYELTCTLENEKLDQCMSLLSKALPIKYSYKEEKANSNLKQRIQLMRK